MARSTGHFLYHMPCEKCGSSDGLAVYSSGTGTCFVCGEYYKDVEGMEEGSSTKPKEGRPTSSKLLTDIAYKEIPKRGLGVEVCRKYRYGIGTMSGGKLFHVAPYYKNGEVVAQHCRSAKKDFVWLGDSKEIDLFGQHLFTPGQKRVVITEGEIDCLTIAQAFKMQFPVVSLPNGVQSAQKFLKHHLEWIESHHEIILAFDDDAEGKKGVSKCAPLFTPGKVKIAKYQDLKDANDLLQAHGESAVLKAIYGAQPYRPDGIVAGTALWELVKQPPKVGYPLPLPKANRMLAGVCGGELILMTAGSGIGKSTLAHEIGYDLLVEQGMTLGCVALEESPKKTAERYVGIKLNKRVDVNREGVTEIELKEGFDGTVGTGRFYVYDHWGSLESENLLGKMRYMAKGLGCQCIILDHISIVVSGMDTVDERKGIDILMTNLRSLVEETQICVIAIVHLKRTDKNYNEGARPSLNDLRGSASLEQLSDTVLALARNQQGDDPNTATLFVLKNRRMGSTGEADRLRYEPSSGRLTAVIDAFSGGVDQAFSKPKDYGF